MKTLSRQRTMFLGMLGIVSLLVLSRIAPAGAQPPAPDPACTAASLHGSYAYSRMGTVVGVGPAAANGVVTFDGQGRLTGTDTASVNGEIIGPSEHLYRNRHIFFANSSRISLLGRNRLPVMRIDGHF